MDGRVAIRDPYGRLVIQLEWALRHRRADLERDTDIRLQAMHQIGSALPANLLRSRCGEDDSGLQRYFFQRLHRQEHGGNIGAVVQEVGSQEGAKLPDLANVWVKHDAAARADSASPELAAR